MPRAATLDRAEFPGARGWLRGVARGAAFVAASSFLYLVHLLGSTGLELLRRDHTRLTSWGTRSWARWTCAILGIEVVVEGTPPSAPFLLVTNHLGYVDIPVLASQVDCVFVSRADAARWPFFGALCRAGGTIFLDREKARRIPGALREIGWTLELGRGVVLFPEGTSSAGESVLPFRSSLLEVASRAGLPVSYGSLTYETPPGAPSAREAVCWWGDMKLLPHLARLFALPAVRATVRFGDRTLRDDDRKILAAKLEQAVRSSFRAVAP